MYDLSIIGAGAAGIAAAKSAIKSGLKTLLIDKSLDDFGGTCLNQGCIPTKFFLNSSKLGKSWETILAENQKLIEKIKTPLFNYLKNKGLEIAWGQASFVDKNSLSLGEKVVKTKNIIIATGSLVNDFIKHPKLISAQEIFNQKKIPAKVLIVGAGYVGLEIASLLNNLGKKIELVEKEERILPGFDDYLAKRLRVILEKKGVKINTSADLNKFNLKDYQLIISAVGRKPNRENLSLEKAGVKLNSQGWIETDQCLRTNVSNIYACGDISGKKLLAYTAEYQARLCIENIKGNKQAEDYKALPVAVFSLPQAAQVGTLKPAAKEIKANFLKFSSSYVYNDLDGFIKVVFDKKETIIGAAIISNQAAELINTLALCIKNNLKLADLKKCLFIHPTLSEMVPLSLFDS